MQITIFTDEINPESPHRAIDLARKWGITHVEIRSLPSGRFPDVPDSELKNLAADLNNAGISVSGVSPGFFKGSCDDPSIEHALAELLPRACEWAQIWGSNLVSCFAFQRSSAGEMPSRVVEIVGRMASTTRRCGCRLVLENEAVCWGATGLEAAEIIRAAGSDNVTLCWDPGNSSHAGSPHPYPDEYNEVKSLITHVHMKNYDPASDSWRLLDDGVVDWKGQLRAFSDDGYNGFLVVETHLQTKSGRSAGDVEGLSDLERNTLLNLQFVRTCLKNS